MSEKPNIDAKESSPTLPAPAVKTVTAKLRCLDHKGETVHTRWGSVTFDRDGLADLEVPESELHMLGMTRPFSWLASDHGPPAAPPEAEKPGKGEKKPPPETGKK